MINDNFNDFPIDYFKFEPIDFIETLGFQNGELANAYLERELTYKTKQFLELNEHGYVRESLQRYLNLNQRNTSVVNCAVGQGKTSSLLRLIKNYSDENPDVYFVFAVPFVSLISQYQKDLINLGVNEDQIFNYEKIGMTSEEGGIDYLDVNRKFHIVTINTLLGNPGDNAPLQSLAKHKYIKDFSILLESNNKQVIFIYDEIHDGIKNFSRIGEAHLWYFSRTIKKNIILSATYNVQSIEVIKMLLKLTDNKLQILESERMVSRPQSRLFLHYDRLYSSKNLSSITPLVARLVRENKNIDILSYSKKLCKKILERNNPLGNILRDQFGEVRDCTSNLEANQIIDDEDITINRYDNNFCNVGTNFKSGVSIEKENHAYIIILPPDSGGPYGALNGIFSDGVNSVIQAVARQRNPGEIHIFLRSPIWMDVDYLIGMNAEQKRILIREIERVGKDPATISTRNNIVIPRVQYLPFSKHITLVKEKWSTQIQRLLIPYSNNQNLQLPHLNDYILMESEKILTLNYFLGKNIASYVTYCAFTNQFYNARLAGYDIPFDTTDTGIDDEQLQQFLEEKLYELSVDENWDNLSIKEKYSRMRNMVLANLSSSLTDYQKAAIKYRVVECLVIKYDSRFSETISPALKYIDLQYNNSQINPGLSEKLTYFIQKVYDSIELDVVNQFKYFKDYQSVQIFEDEKVELFAMIEQLKSDNPAFKLNLMNFFRNTNQDNIGRRFYDFIIGKGFVTVPYNPRLNGISQSYKKIIQSYLIPNL